MRSEIYHNGGQNESIHKLIALNNYFKNLAPVVLSYDLLNK
jgi:hypothetical protein